MNKLDENFINKDSTLTRAIEILNIMYPNNSRVTCALSFEYIDEKKGDCWLYDSYVRFEDIDDNSLFSCRRNLNICIHIVNTINFFSFSFSWD